MHINFCAHRKGKLTLQHNKTYSMNIALPWYYFHSHLDKDDIFCAGRNIVTLSSGIRHFDMCNSMNKIALYFFYIRNFHICNAKNRRYFTRKLSDTAKCL